MRSRIHAFLIAGGLVAAALVPAAPAAAQRGGAQQPERAWLEQNAARIDSELNQKTGAMQRVELKRQREQIDAAIKQVQSGRKVNVQEIDQILDQTTVKRYE